MKTLRTSRVPLLDTRSTKAELPPPSQEAGYRIRGTTLQNIRDAHRRQHPLCVHCLAVGRVRAWEELDHKIPLHKGGTDTPDNRQGLCRECHVRKTAEDLKA